MINLEARALTNALIKLEQACDELPQIAEQARAEALGHLWIGADRNVYSTPPGARPRTGELREGLDARSRATKNTGTVEVRGTAAHTLWVELGREGMTIPALQALAAANSNPYAPISLGRSGLNYTKAGPILTPAQAFALFRLKELFVGKVRERLG
ncbi:hypothetical protein [Deinococcus apachensis]|uniref:hypothetical protein n=1 Tax=Deinococcus apachensis TaxID=309886 RepID=UPI00037CCE0E|nr:hypothetical protein [Deinococcus apachensis]